MAISRQNLSIEDRYQKRQAHDCNGATSRSNLRAWAPFGDSNTAWVGAHPKHHYIAMSAHEVGVEEACEPKNAPFTHIPREKLQIGIPFVTDDFSAGETPHRYNLSAWRNQGEFKWNKKGNEGECSPFLWWLLTEPNLISVLGVRPCNMSDPYIVSEIEYSSNRITLWHSTHRSGNSLSAWAVAPLSTNCMPEGKIISFT
jgi:hypothetical protein